MDPLTLGLLSVVLLVVLILLGFHIAVALSLISFGAIYLLTGQLNVALTLLGTTSYSAIMDYVFAVVPFFVLMGLLTTASGTTSELFQATERMTRRIAGGLGISTVLANTIFAAITGVSVASAAVFSKVAVPEMEKLNYNRRFSLGIVASSSLLGMLLPPSILMIIYGLLTEQSVGRLFAAGVLPGLLLAAVLMIGIYTTVRRRPELGGRLADGGAALIDLAGHKEVSVLRPWPVYALILLIVVGIYTGVMTPSEAGAVASAGALVMVFARGTRPVSALWRAALETCSVAGSVFMLLIAAQMYSRMLTLTGLPAEITSMVTSTAAPPLVVVMLLILLILILGMFLDSISILLLTMPIMYPVIVALGYDPIWFGIVTIFAVEIGLLTPPFGMVIFAMKAALPDDYTIKDIYMGCLPFVVLLLAVLMVLIFVPELTLWFPRFLYG